MIIIIIILILLLLYTAGKIKGKVLTILAQGEAMAPKEGSNC